MKKAAERIIRKLQLIPHIEGGYFKEIYKSPRTINCDDLKINSSEKYNLMTTIYYMLVEEQVSKFHFLDFDETLLFHAGSPLVFHLIDQSGNYSRVVLGPDVEKGQYPQFTVKAGILFGGELMDKESFGLISCIVSPGFEYDIFHLIPKEELLSRFPDHEEIILRLS